MKKYLIALSLALLAGCGEGGTSTNNDTVVKDVMFSVNPDTGPSCPNADDSSSFESDDYRSITCTWRCANYKGQSRVYVSIDFVASNSTNQKWGVDNEFISSGIC